MKTLVLAATCATLLFLAACKLPTAQPKPPVLLLADSTEAYLEADGSLDSILQILEGARLIFDTTFILQNPDEGWQKKQVNGECHLIADLKYPGLTVRVDGYYPDCPPEPFLGSEIKSLRLQFNDIALRPDAHKYQISGDSVSLYWHYSGEWRKFRLGNEEWLVGSLDNRDCNGSFCLYNATLLVRLNSKTPGFYFFDHFPQPGLLADTDGDQRLEWLALEYDDWQQDTINLTVKPYELNDGKFKRMRNASGKPYEARIRFSNGMYEPRGARLVKKYWPG